MKSTTPRSTHNHEEHDIHPKNMTEFHENPNIPYADLLENHKAPVSASLTYPSRVHLQAR